MQNQGRERASERASSGGGGREEERKREGGGQDDSCRRDNSDKERDPERQLVRRKEIEGQRRKG